MPVQQARPRVPNQLNPNKTRPTVPPARGGSFIAETKEAAGKHQISFDKKYNKKLAAEWARHMLDTGAYHANVAAVGPP